VGTIPRLAALLHGDAPDLFAGFCMRDATTGVDNFNISAVPEPPPGRSSASVLSELGLMPGERSD